jgi:hypothetical protein
MRLQLLCSRRNCYAGGRLSTNQPTRLITFSIRSMCRHRLACWKMSSCIVGLVHPTSQARSALPPFPEVRSHPGAHCWRFPAMSDAAIAPSTQQVPSALNMLTMARGRRVHNLAVQKPHAPASQSEVKAKGSCTWLLWALSSVQCGAPCSMIVE